MEKIFWKLAVYIAFIMLSLNAISCSSDDDENNNETLTKLDGIWAEVKEECFLNNELVATKNRSNWTKWNFHANGEVVRYATTFTDNGTFSLKGNQLNIRLSVTGDKSWTENMNCTIIESTDNTLVWKEPYEDDEYDYTIMYLTKIGTNENNENQESTIKGETAKFIGAWKFYFRPTAPDTWYFEKDGTCSYGSHKGTWAYIEEAKVLSTTISGWSWDVISIESNKWIGRTSNNIYTFERVN